MQVGTPTLGRCARALGLKLISKDSGGGCGRQNLGEEFRSLGWEQRSRGKGREKFLEPQEGG